MGKVKCHGFCGSVTNAPALGVPLCASCERKIEAEEQREIRRMAAKITAQVRAGH